jgi:hypothetical protein
MAGRGRNSRTFLDDGCHKTEMNYGVNYGGQKSSVSIHRLPEFPKLGKHFFMGAKRVIGAGFACRRDVGWER